MPGSSRVAYGNEIYDSIIAPTSVAGAVPGTLAWSSANVASATTAELTTTIPGLLPGDIVDLYLVSGPLLTGLQIANVRVSATNTLAVTWVNSSGGALTVPTATWNANLTRPENPSNLPPNAV
jgi:hypothetical protein